MRAWIVSGSDARLADDVPEATLGEGDVTVDVEYSSINYKDGLALAGNPGVAKIDPLIPGIDLVGTVASSESPRWAVGDRVIGTGWGMGETHSGGLAERARVHAGWLVPLPAGLEARHAAAIGTAGLTAMLATMAIEDSDGDVLITGSTGGVGSIAIALLSRLGRRVTASTGRIAEEQYLRDLGAAAVVDRREFEQPGKPLQKGRWGAAVDSVGSTTLANVLAQTTRGGVVASCGLVGGSDLPATVMPFILRGVSLIGIDSAECPVERRIEAWRRLAAELDMDLLDELTTTIAIEKVAEVAANVVAGTVRGRKVVAIGPTRQ